MKKYLQKKVDLRLRLKKYLCGGQPVKLHSNPIDMDVRRALPVELINAQARSPLLFVCEHASNYIPPELHNLGLSDSARHSHIAWDPGALEVARHLGELLQARVIASPVSRLVYDCNRPPDSPDAIPARSEHYDVPGNRDLTAAQKAARVRTYYTPFHDLLAQQIAQAPGPQVLVTIHSFSPVYAGRTRETEVGVIHDSDHRLADQLLARLLAKGDRQVRRNDPYGPQDGVTHTLLTHAISNRLLNVMLEIRNDLITAATAQRQMAEWLAGSLVQALADLGIQLHAGETNAIPH